MTSVCGKISASLSINCDAPLQGGLFEDLTVINFEDISSVTRNNTNPQIIEAIILASGASAYLIEGKNNSLAGKAALVVGKYDNTFDHEISGVVFDISPSAKLQLEKAGNGKFVCIARNNYKGTSGNSAYEIYGLDGGLYASVIERDSTNQDTQGAYIFTLKTKDNKEPHLPASFFITSYAATKTAVEALV